MSRITGYLVLFLAWAATAFGRKLEKASSSYASLSSANGNELNFCFTRLQTSVGYDGDYSSAEQTGCLLVVDGYTERQCQTMYGLVYSAVSRQDYDTLPAVYYDLGQGLCVLLEPTNCRRYAETLGMLWTADDDCPSSVNDWSNSVLLSGLLNGSPRPQTPTDCSGRNVTSSYSYYSSFILNLKNATSVCRGSQSIPTTDYVLPWSRAYPRKNFTAPLQPGAFTTSGYNYTAHSYGRRLTEWLFGQP